MNRPKTKRIVGTVAILLALSLVAALALHKHEEPKVTGNLSKEDVIEISKVALKLRGDYLKNKLREDFKGRDVSSLLHHFKQYMFRKTLTVSVDYDSYVTVFAGTKQDSGPIGCTVQKYTNGWDVANMPEAIHFGWGKW